MQGLQQFCNCCKSSKVGRLLGEMADEAIIAIVTQSVPQKKVDLDKAKPVVLPFYHQVYRNLKAVAQKGLG